MISKSTDETIDKHVRCSLQSFMLNNVLKLTSAGVILFIKCLSCKGK